MVMKSIEGGSTINVLEPKGFRVYEREQFYKRATWKLKLSIWPRKCYENKLPIKMFTYAYKGQSVWTGPGSPIVEYTWLSKEEYIFLKLKGEI